VVGPGQTASFTQPSSYVIAAKMIEKMTAI
jgi:hypothetical protein